MPIGQYTVYLLALLGLGGNRIRYRRVCVLLLDRRLVYASGGSGMSSGMDARTVAMYSSSAGSTVGRVGGGRSSGTDRDGGGVGGGGGTCLVSSDGAAAVPFSRSIVPVSVAVPVAVR